MVRGDLTSLMCDWWLLPSGTDEQGVAGEIGTHYLRDDRVHEAASRPDWRRYAPTRDERAVVLVEPSGGPGIIAVHTGDDGSESAEWFADALEEAATVALRHGGRFGPSRPLPLMAFPLLGTGAGGGGSRKGSVMEALLERADAVAASGIDLVLVLANAAAYSAAQRLRSSDPTLSRWAAVLESTEVALAEKLASHARAGKLVTFLGAGLSQAAGLPGWTDLLAKLGASAGITSAAQVSDLTTMDPRDAGDVLQHRLGGSEELDRALRDCFGAATRSSLSHALLASLPLREAATTNYDRLFETAWGAAIGGPGPTSRDCVTVLPAQDAGDAKHWLLKLHGDVDDPTRRLVLSRDEYRRFEQAGGAVAGVLQTMLLTRHLLIVGYGLRDETFHRIAHEVRAVRASPVQTAMTISAGAGQQIGTALLVDPPGLRHDVLTELKIVDLSCDGSTDRATAARRQDLLLDLVGSLAAAVESYVLGAGWDELSDHGADEELRAALLAVERVTGLDEPMQRSVREVLRRFGLDADGRRR